MQLTRAFQVNHKEVVAFVGGGGKTTTMFRLAEELAVRGKRVVTTTTTRIFAAQIKLAPQFVRVQEFTPRKRGEPLDFDQLKQALDRTNNVLLIGGEGDDGKAFGVDPTLIDQLIQLADIDAVLIEADGSRMRPFKAPADHEPAIPASTTLLVPIVGLDVLGKTLDNANVHRAEFVSQIVGISLGDVLTGEHIARVLGDPRGGLKNKPIGARVIPFLNKVETPTQTTAAQNIATALLKNQAIDAVAVGALHNQENPITQLRQRVAAVILAAGGSTRMQGSVKQLLPWGDTTFIGNAVLNAQQTQIFEIIVVTGNRSEEVERELHSIENVRTAHNPAWSTGRASSVRTGIQALSDTVAAAIFINADQPFLTPHVINTIIETFYQTAAPIVVPSYQGNTGSPVLISRQLFAEMKLLQGEQGGRDLLQKYSDQLVTVEIQDERAGTDLDTPEEYRAALQRKSTTE